MTGWLRLSHDATLVLGAVVFMALLGLALVVAWAWNYTHPRQ